MVGQRHCTRIFEPHFGAKPRPYRWYETGDVLAGKNHPNLGVDFITFIANETNAVM